MVVVEVVCVGVAWWRPRLDAAVTESVLWSLPICAVLRSWAGCLAGGVTRRGGSAPLSGAAVTSGRCWVLLRWWGGCQWLVGVVTWCCRLLVVTQARWGLRGPRRATGVTAESR